MSSVICIVTGAYGRTVEEKDARVALIERLTKLEARRDETATWLRKHERAGDTVTRPMEGTNAFIAGKGELSKQRPSVERQSVLSQLSEAERWEIVEYRGTIYIYCYVLKKIR